ncbi:hypothetical protein GCK72_022871 [Caenorhabditis remanei]|uniref:Intein C-terminal splicing domain-containing protein n=1 Tax=Caenorhabditis remanei TaxID=31234 RepID=A0A6A5FV09_CAERE|nr:hypothetical protein GCK72_022871 [Caenorhabditis remanei]KAF1746417.1 hypothetical protein GCK72_022871 [Caenorhabditis remanei]
MASPTLFRTNGTLSCPLFKTWCYVVTMYEEDTFHFLDDRIDTSGVHCVDANQISYHLIGDQNGDGFYNHYYEIALSVTHNCTTKRHNIRTIRNKVYYAKITSEEVFHNWNVQLIDEGERVPDFE